MTRILVTGAAGFIGSWASSAFSGRGDEVLAVDNFSRRGNTENANWLHSTSSVLVRRLDIRDAAAVDKAVSDFRPEAVVHLAAQVAVTTSVESPRLDFETNALGTFNLLEAARRRAPETTFIFASTNKVYGGLSGQFRHSAVEGLRHVLPHPASRGVPESHPLDFHSPYGCSKGAADQYVRDYARIYGMRTFSLRQSCIYGPRQFGVEDQGWVAWFIIAAILGRSVSVFGSGNQVRDLLHVDDLVSLYCNIVDSSEVPGGIYNIGGGPGQTLSLLELIGSLKSRGVDLVHTFAEERPGDQPIFVSDISKAEADFGWRPKTGVESGVDGLIAWVKENSGLVRAVLEG